MEYYEVEQGQGSDGKDELFLVVHGERIAKRGRPGTPQAGKWVVIVPGWDVKQIGGKGGEIEVSRMKDS
jgi:hypothetical protein